MHRVLRNLAALMREAFQILALESLDFEE